MFLTVPRYRGNNQMPTFVVQGTSPGHRKYIAQKIITHVRQVSIGRGQVELSQLQIVIVQLVLVCYSCTATVGIVLPHRCARPLAAQEMLGKVIGPEGREIYLH